jgi:hypothetical protein
MFELLAQACRIFDIFFVKNCCRQEKSLINVVDGRIILRGIFRKWVVEYGLDWAGSE